MLAMPLTDQQRQVVTESFAQLVPITDHAASLFYDHLWTIAPETRVLFHNTDMAQQRLKLMQTLGMAVRALHNLDDVAPLLVELGRRHIAYGVTREQYDHVRAALLWMIENCMGNAFTEETREAWIAAYDAISAITLSAYD